MGARDETLGKMGREKDETGIKGLGNGEVRGEKRTFRVDHEEAKKKHKQQGKAE